MSWQKRAKEHGWMPPMLMLAAAAVILFVRVAIFWPVRNAQGAQILHAATWLIWLIVGGMPTILVATESIRNLQRYGGAGFARPRWWFEWGRLLWIAFIFSALTLPFAFSVPGGPVGQFAMAVFPFVMLTAVGAFWLFVFMTTVGYVLSVARHLPRSGHAFECVHYFYVIIGGVGILGVGAVWWPPAVIWPDGVLFGLFETLGVVWLLMGMQSIISRYQQY